MIVIWRRQDAAERIDDSENEARWWRRILRERGGTREYGKEQYDTHHEPRHEHTSGYKVHWKRKTLNRKTQNFCVLRLPVLRFRQPPCGNKTSRDRDGLAFLSLKYARATARGAPLRWRPGLSASAVVLG